ncbi:MAG: CvpA family protein [Desulfotomaculaceae bacterium]|nr:CvpA family protein [Desulfotomaculaceae bacterium]
MNWLDWLIVVIVALSALQGLRRGLLASLAGLAGTLVGLFVAYTYHRPLAEYLVINWNVEEKIKPLIMQLFKVWTPSQSPVPSATQPGQLISTGGVAAGQMPNIGEYLASSFTSLLLDALCFLALLLATTWAINLAGSILTKVAQFSLLGAPNRLGGLLFGTVRGLAVVIIILLLLTPFQHTTSQPGTSDATPHRISAFESSMLLPYFEPLFDAIGRQLPTVTTMFLKEFGGLGDS